MMNTRSYLPPLLEIRPLEEPDILTLSAPNDGSPLQADFDEFFY